MTPAAPSLLSTRPVLVTGGAGFIGVNLADRLASEGYSVLIFDSLVRPGVEDNLEWLKSSHSDKISFACCDLRDRAAVTEAVRDCRAVFHFAAQVAVTTSLVEPRFDFDVNVGGTISLLEVLRLSNPHAPMLFASTNKVYGNLSDVELERQMRLAAAEIDAVIVAPGRIDQRDPHDTSSLRPATLRPGAGTLASSSGWPWSQSANSAMPCRQPSGDGRLSSVVIRRVSATK